MNIDYENQGIAPINDEIIREYATRQQKWGLFDYRPLRENEAIQQLFYAAKKQINNSRGPTDHSVQGLLYMQLSNSIKKPTDYNRVEYAIKAEKELAKAAETIILI